MVYIVENNLYGMSVPIEKAAAKLNIADRACAYDMPGMVSFIAISLTGTFLTL